jgi:WD40 repeat protein/serine/threonine protein kinase
MNEQAIFSAALPLERDRRAAYLHEACGADAELRRRIELLLDAHEQAGSFMQRPAAGGVTEVHRPISEGPGTVIGPYKLLQQIGEGGFGVVYMAEQLEPVRRKVALKIIKPGMDTKEVIARFESERQALALMDHPNVARVLDAGATATGRPYFVMELVRGVPITEFCDKQHLPATGRLELFRAVCLAVQHAHQKGIIHRDLKPSNILVTLHDGNPVPKVIDFGVAKATNQQLTQRTLFTAYGQMVGTPAYMSPEQAEMSGLDIDTRSDIYSLGVLLYELLTGTTPLESNRLRQAGYAEMQRLIREVEPPPPSTRMSALGGEATVLAGNRGTDVKRLTQLLRGDLDWIVMKALEKDRNRRYETPGAFAADVERFLHNEPIVARAPSALYKLRKFARRNRAAVAMAAIVLLLLVLGTAGTSIGLVWAVQAEDEARHDAERARDAEQLAAQRLVDVQRERDAADQARRDAVAVAEQLKIAVAQQDSHRLAAHSTAVLPDHPATALLLAIAATERSPTRTVFHNNALLAAVRACREERTLFAPPSMKRAKWTGRTAISAVQVTPDGKRAVAIGVRRDGWPERDYENVDSACVYALETGKVTATLKLPGLLLETVAISPDGRLMAAAADHITSVQYADGKTVAYTDRAVRMWDLRTGAEVRVLKGHTDHVCSLCFDTKGQRLLSASWDGSARVWDVATGQVRHVLQDGTRSLAYAEFSSDPEGRRVLTVSHVRTRCRELGQLDARTLVDPPVCVGVAIRRIAPAGGSSRSQSDGELPAPRLWDAHTGKRLAVLGTDPISELGRPTAAFTPDGAGIVTADTSRVQLWDAADGKLNHSAETEPGASITEMPMGPSPLRIVHHAAGMRDDRPPLIWQGSAQTPRTWHRAACTVRLGEDDTVTEYQPKFLDASRAGPLRIATAAGDTITIRDSDFATRLVLSGHEGRVTAAEFLPGGQRLLSASADGTVRLWDLDRKEPVRVIDRTDGMPTSRAAFVHAGKRVITASTGGRLVVLSDAETGTRIRDIGSDVSLATSPLHQKLLGSLCDFDVGLDGTQLVTVHADSNPIRDPKQGPQPSELYTPVRVWDLRTGKQRFVLEGFRRAVATARFSPDGQRILTFCDGNLRYANVNARGEIYSTGSGGNSYPRVDVWDADTGKHLCCIAPEGLESRDFAVWSPDGTRVVSNELAAMTGGVGLAVKIESEADLERLKVKKPVQPRNAAAEVYDAATGARLLDLQGTGRIDTAAYSPDGRLVLGYRRYPGLPQGVTVWDAATGVQRYSVRGHVGDITAAVFSPDGRLVLTASTDGTARLWDAATGESLRVLYGHRNGVTAACFSPDARRVATASKDGTARIWTTATGEEWVTLPLGHGAFTSVEFSADGARLLTTSSDGKARIWPVDPLPLAVARKPRELTEEERARFQVNDAR